MRHPSLVLRLRRPRTRLEKTILTLIVGVAVLGTVAFFVGTGMCARAVNDLIGVGRLR
jgi:hypothetical protein